MGNLVRKVTATRGVTAATLFTSAVLCGLGCSSASTVDAAVACPALKPEVAALDAQISKDASVNAMLRVYVQAAKDTVWASTQVEHLAATACRRIGADLGLKSHEMQPRSGPGGAAVGACDPVNARVDAILRQGIRLWVTIVPAQCQANNNAFSRCTGVCDVNSDPVCNASCRAHANIHASCRPATITVRASQGAGQAEALISTLNANLPALIEAQYTLGQRVVQDARTIAKVGAGLSKRLDGAGSDAKACAGAAGDEARTAATRIRISVRVANNLNARVAGR